MKVLLFISSIFILVAGCSFSDLKKNDKNAKSDKVPNDYFVNASLYNYYTAEYKALSYQAFNSASIYLELVKLKNPGRNDLAIVLDIDETLLDNSPYQAKLFEIKGSYDTLWNVWCDLACANPLPGSVEFLQYADSLGFNIFYVTNRKMKFVYESTFKNMVEVGFPQVDSVHLILRTEGNSKEKRRLKIAESNEIIMLVGDNIGDFYEDTRDYNSRDSSVISHKSEFGRKLIVLPNAMYGNWVESLGIEQQSDIDSLISIMTKPFNK